DSTASDFLESPPWTKRASGPGAVAAAPVFPPHYEVLREVGHGGMGVVFECFDRNRNMRVALKTLTRISPLRLYAFKQEFRALAGMSHPNLAALYELVQESGQYFLSMEFIDGVSFLDYVRPGGVCVRERLLAVLPQITGALNAIH